ncbi:MAG: tRNA pseudouridine(55) synthase TruB [Spirochaetaceae bacterium]|nr:tRNA pseudouridine(55) synthase TruB [Spirochaetaceae bacterium]
MTSPFMGVVLLDKTEGETSFSALGNLKRRFNTRRIGHTGTLDPLATGLLVALVGPATRCARFFSSLDKTYVADVCFGSETDTDDCTGQIIKTAPVPVMESVLDAAIAFVGEIRQIPPAYSAIHVDGRRAYERARAGETVEIPARQVTIHEITGEIIDQVTIRLTVSCSSGTYIRSLARDLGRAVGSAAHLSALRRTRVGPFNVDEVSQIAETQLGAVEIGTALLRLDGFSELSVDPTVATTMWNGGRVPAPARGAELGGRIVARRGDVPVSIGRWQDGFYRYEVVFPKPESIND